MKKPLPATSKPAPAIKVHIKVHFTPLPAIKDKGHIPVFSFTGDLQKVPVTVTDNGDIAKNISHLIFGLTISKTLVYIKGEPDF